MFVGPWIYKHMTFSLLKSISFKISTSWYFLSDIFSFLSFFFHLQSGAQIGSEYSVARIGSEWYVVQIGYECSLAHIGSECSLAHIGSECSLANMGS